jgi:glycosyltransferase involved in cell wall biosynthesis
MTRIDRKLKVLHLITKSNFGGAQRYVFDMATGMSEAGHDVLVAMGGKGPLLQKLNERNVRTATLANMGRDVAPLDDVKAFLGLISLFYSERPDVIHLNSSKAGALGALAARIVNGATLVERLLWPGRAGSKIIFTGHGWAFNEDRDDAERFAIGLLHWLTIMLAHRTIAVSARTKDQVARLPFAEGRLSVVHNGVGELQLLPRDEAESAVFGADRDELLAGTPLVVGTLAELHKNKGLDHAIHGFAQLKKQSSRRFLFVILGEGEERAALERLAADLGVSDMIRFAGYKENGMRLLSAFDIFLLPSITEAFPYAILEAGNAGLPVVATAVGGIPEVIDDMESGILIQSRNPGEIARAMAYLAEHPERREELGRALKDRITGKFSADRMLEETLRIYGN